MMWQTLLLTIALTLVAAKGYAFSPSFRRSTTTPLAATRGRNRDLPTTTNRRDLLSAAGILTGLAVWGQHARHDMPGVGRRPPPQTVTTTSPAMSVPEILALLEAQGDRRFLHAVVASDYHLLYTYAAEDHGTRSTSLRTGASVVRHPMTADTTETTARPAADLFWNALAADPLSAAT